MLKGHQVVDANKCKRKDQSCFMHIIGIWNLRSMNQVKFEIVKLEIEYLNIAILGVSKQI